MDKWEEVGTIRRPTYRMVVMDNRANPLYMRGGCGRVYRTSLGELTRPVIGQRAPAMRQAAARTVPPPATGSKPGFPARDGSNAMSAFFGYV